MLCIVEKERILKPRNAGFTIDFAHLTDREYALVDAGNIFEETIQKKSKN
jgi:endonuclease IV